MPGMARFFVVPVILALTLGTACSSNDGGAPAATGAPDAGPLGGDRPVTMFVPSSYRSDKRWPLVILLHGYGASGVAQELLFQLQPLAESRGFLFMHPDGTVDSTGKRFWNATDACCDFDHTGIDDSAYIQGLIDQAKSIYSVDPKRVYLIGHSNGAYMSYRMACDHADSIAAIASLAGATYLDTTKCTPTEPVNVLEMHGNADQTVPYDGEAGSYPGAQDTVKIWATYDGCSLTPGTSAPPEDFAGDSAAETTITRYDSGCRPGGSAELWTLDGQGHIPSVNDNWRNGVIDWLFAHSKP